jgi:hypothetical protein
MTNQAKQAARSILVLLAGAVALSACATTDAQLVQRSKRPDLTPEKIALYRACSSEASMGHYPAAVNRRRLSNNQSYRTHVQSMTMFCEVYGGFKPASALKLESKPGSSFAEHYADACRAQAEGGRSALFKPKSDHVERMKSLCDRLAADLPKPS